ncbi:hypothetical protein SteCoe_11462 [Stentor coeruleus]|uniref:Uncharacterized protein n=1 Tax=Stentor coeruleus TaxID=5963 RepID=A0A1R2CD25_9CILI|nr:hypothetical protein SteCoe_11462 [Stentor coeruleus]
MKNIHDNTREQSPKVKKSTVSVKLMASASKPINYCFIDLKKQRFIGKKIADEEYFRALKHHKDPRKDDQNASFNTKESLDHKSPESRRPMSVEPDQRYSFENWMKYKTHQAKQEHKQQLLDEYSLRMKHRQNGMSYKEWLKISLAKERSEKKHRRVKEERDKIDCIEKEKQKCYEKETRKSLERKQRLERLSKLSIKRSTQQNSDERPISHSPLLLAYSPNKYNKCQNSIYSKNSKFSTSPFDDY